MLLVMAVSSMLSACASSDARSEPNADDARVAYDPLEPVNRPIKAFNDTFDRLLLRPIAKGYEAVIPRVIRQRVTDFSRNLNTPLVGINNLLQGKGAAATNDLGRFIMNSTFGLGGLFDPATSAGFERNNEDFGQTLAAWGAPSGPYLVLPVFGPSTVRDGLMTPLNILADPLVYMDNRSIRDKIVPLRTVDQRQRLFAAEALLKDSSDEYITLRESFLQRREYLVYDGNPPQDEDFYDDFYGEFPEEEEQQ